MCKSLACGSQRNHINFKEGGKTILHRDQEAGRLRDGVAGIARALGRHPERTAREGGRALQGARDAAHRARVGRRERFSRCRAYEQRRYWQETFKADGIELAPPSRTVDRGASKTTQAIISAVDPEQHRGRRLRRSQWRIWFGLPVDVRRRLLNIVVKYDLWRCVHRHSLTRREITVPTELRLSRIKQGS